MGIRHMNAVWERSQHKGSELLLMLAIADMANDVGLAWPGYVYLAHKTRMARRSVMRLAATCADTGELWVLNRKLQRSNIYIVTVDLSIDELRQAAIQGGEMGAIPTTDSDNLTPPPQVLEVVTRCHQVVPKRHHVVIPESPGSDTAMSPDPVLPVITLLGEKEDDLLSSSWSPLLDAIALTMTSATFDTWLRGSRLIDATNGTWIVQLRNSYAVEWVENRLYPSNSFQGLMKAHAPDVQQIKFVMKGEQS